MTASTASAKSHRSADTTETKFSDRSCNDRPIPPSTRIIDPVSRKVHVRFLAAAGRKVSGPPMFRKHGKIHPSFQRAFFNTTFPGSNPTCPATQWVNAQTARSDRRRVSGWRVKFCGQPRWWITPAGLSLAARRQGASK